jgi:hypothetical protein
MRTMEGIGMGEATGPITPLSEMSTAEMLIAQEEAVMAALHRIEMVLRQDVRPPVEVIALTSRLAEFEWTIAGRNTEELARLLPPASLSAVPGRPRHRAPSRQDSPLLGAIDGGKPRGRRGRHAAGARSSDGNVTYLPERGDQPAG